MMAPPPQPTAGANRRRGGADWHSPPARQEGAPYRSHPQRLARRPWRQTGPSLRLPRLGYVKKNAIAGRRFESWAEFEAHLDRWTREVADRRKHGTTGVAPAERFAEKVRALRPLSGRSPFGQLRDLVRKVQSDCAIDLDTNSYSVPWRLIGESVQVVVLAGRVIIRHAGQVVADHAVCNGRRQRIVDRTHFVGVAGAEGLVWAAAAIELRPPALLRPLAEYEAVVGGGW